MSLDLSAAVETVAREFYKRDSVPDDETWPEWDALVVGSTGQRWQSIGYRDAARRALAVAAPLIEAQVRAQVAARIDTLRTEHVSSYGPAFDDGFAAACEIAALLTRGADA